MSGPDSVSGEPSSTTKKPLPAFARKLPQDPYYGASIVNPANRETLGLNGGAPPPRGLTPPGLPPGGLVGVIAGEERARALRRGSPNTLASAEAQGVSPLHFGETSGMMPTGMPPVLSSHDQAQIQMSAQMNQMMYMQMQWMQQMQLMMQMQGQGGIPTNVAMGGQVTPPTNVNSSAASSVSQQPIVSGPQGAYPHDPRTMNTANPYAAPWNRPKSSYPDMFQGTQAYAPSIAPSERSNVGMAPRYRPVSIPSSVNHSRESVFGASNSTLHTVKEKDETPAVRVEARQPRGSDKEEDDQGWAEMKRKRDLKMSSWKMKKGQNELANLYPSGM